MHAIFTAQRTFTRRSTVEKVDFLAGGDGARGKRPTQPWCEESGSSKNKIGAKKCYCKQTRWLGKNGWLKKSLGGRKIGNRFPLLLLSCVKSTFFSKNSPSFARVLNKSKNESTWFFGLFSLVLIFEHQMCPVSLGLLSKNAVGIHIIASITIQTSWFCGLLCDIWWPRLYSKRPYLKIPDKLLTDFFTPVTAKGNKQTLGHENRAFKCF